MVEPIGARVFNVMDLEREIEAQVRNTASSRERPAVKHLSTMRRKMRTLKIRQREPGGRIGPH